MRLLPQCLETGLVATDGYKCTLHGGNQLDLKVCHSGSTAREQAEWKKHMGPKSIVSILMQIL